MFNKQIELFTSQAKGYIEVIRLKLRIIGFSNKRSGLFTRLGEAVYRQRGEREDITPGANTIKIIGDIENSEIEIVEAEKAINITKGKLTEEWQEFNRGRPKGESEPAKENEKEEITPAVKDDVIKLQPDETGDVTAAAKVASEQ